MILSIFSFSLTLIWGVLIGQWWPEKKKLLIVFGIATVFIYSFSLYWDRKNAPPSKSEFSSALEERDKQAQATDKTVQKISYEVFELKQALLSQQDKKLLQAKYNEILQKLESEKSLEDYVFLTNFAWQKGEYLKALTFIEKASKLNLKTKKDKALLMQGYGLIYLSMGNLQLAIDALTTSIKLDPSKVNVYNYLGIAYHRQEREMDAEKWYVSGIQRATDEVWIYHNLSNMYAEQYEYKKAIAILKTAINIDPQNSYTRHLMAKLYEEQGKDTEAETELKAAIKLEFNDRNWDALTRFYLERPHLFGGKIKHRKFEM